MRKPSRRELLLSGAALAGASTLARRAQAQEPAPENKPPVTRRGRRTAGPVPVVSPNVPKLPYKVVGGVKVFHLVAEPVTRDFTEGLTVKCWGYNGSSPGPLIEVNQGDRCRFYVTNHLPEVTSLHWHGVLLPSGMDGVGALTQEPIPPGVTFRYEFTFGETGTFMYHPHYDEMTQIALGMSGMIVVHPRRPVRRPPDRDYAIMLHEWLIDIDTGRPDPMAMADFNVLTINGKVFPGTDSIVAETGERVRIRIGNLSPMDHHPMHLHGHSFKVVETDGGAIPESAQWPETTVLVPVGGVRSIEFDAVPGDWAFHCHMTHHMMNQMGHEAPNLIGVDTRGIDKKIQKLVPGYMTMGTNGMAAMAHMNMPVPPNSIPMKGAPGPFGYIDMGGMFTIVKVRDRLTGDPGWYDHPPGTVARAATPDELRNDGIDAG